MGLLFPGRMLRYLLFYNCRVLLSSFYRICQRNISQVNHGANQAVSCDAAAKAADQVFSHSVLCNTVLSRLPKKLSPSVIPAAS